MSWDAKSQKSRVEKVESFGGVKKYLVIPVVIVIGRGEIASQVMSIFAKKK